MLPPILLSAFLLAVGCTAGCAVALYDDFAQGHLDDRRHQVALLLQDHLDRLHTDLDILRFLPDEEKAAFVAAHRQRFLSVKRLEIRRPEDSALLLPIPESIAFTSRPATAAQTGSKTFEIPGGDTAALHLAYPIHGPAPQSLVALLDLQPVLRDILGGQSLRKEAVAILDDYSHMILAAAVPPGMAEVIADLTPAKRQPLSLGPRKLWLLHFPQTPHPLTTLATPWLIGGATSLSLLLLFLRRHRPLPAPMAEAPPPRPSPPAHCPPGAPRFCIFNVALEHLPILLLHLSPQGTILAATGRLATQPPWRDAAKRNLLGLFGGDPRLRHALRRAAAGEETMFQALLGQNVFEGWILPSIGKENGQLTGLFMDVSETQRAQSYFQAVFNHGTVGIALVDPETWIVLEANPSFRKLVSGSDQPLTGQELPALLGPGFDPNSDWNGLDLRLERPDGEECWIRLQRGEAGSNITLVFAKDVTTRRNIETRLAHSARLATLGELAASLAHDFGQPLMVIRSAAETCLDGLRDGNLPAARHRRNLEMVLDQTQRLDETIKHVLRFARPDLAPPSPIDPVAAVRAALKLVIKRMRQDGIQLSWHPPVECAPVLGHSVRLEQVLINLLTNACDAVCAAQMIHALDQDWHPMVTITCHEQAGEVVIRVGDNGPGFNPRMLDTLFQPFTTSKPPGKGTGLGLSICLGIVAEMGGGIDIENTDPGALVTIWLPALRPLPDHGDPDFAAKEDDEKRRQELCV
ncbi:ATP-binding protein [Telmatospirillum sp. J64-1]|uniref:PAS domain-containing sensor histidine kinase n=1 Tax=Telmatospirillum sp. J64-1 TaxID=2502183 RepID=UPI00115E5E6C|nr:ATP-binding protein [Telmatospirillum sp. J64-1]